MRPEIVKALERLELLSPDDVTRLAGEARKELPNQAHLSDREVLGYLLDLYWPDRKCIAIILELECSGYGAKD